jgi:hypothetical protein
VTATSRHREIVEGALAAALGRDEHENPYDAEYGAESHRQWCVGFVLGELLLEREFAVGLAELDEAA